MEDAHGIIEKIKEDIRDGKGEEEIFQSLSPFLGKDPQTDERVAELLADISDVRAARLLHRMLASSEEKKVQKMVRRSLYRLKIQGIFSDEPLHKKAVSRFSEMLKQAANKLEISTLTKQSRLMANLFDHYFAEVPEEEWEKLYNVLQSHNATLRNSIMNEEGPIKKENAEKALNSLLSVLEYYICQNVQKAA